MKLVSEKHQDLDAISLYVKLYKFNKGYLLLISDKIDMGIGTVSLGTPMNIENMKTTSSSYRLFGVDKNYLSKILVERAANQLNEPVLSLLFLKTKKKEEELAKPLINLLDDCLKEIKEND
jgi:peptidyl-tRNA hydrolase